MEVVTYIEDQIVEQIIQTCSADDLRYVDSVSRILESLRNDEVEDLKEVAWAYLLQLINGREMVERIQACVPDDDESESESESECEEECITIE